MEFRKISLEDVPAFAKMLDRNRTHLSEYFPGTLYSNTNKAATRKFVEEKIQEDAAKTCFYFIIEEKGDIIGMVNVKNIDWSIPKCELAYFIDKDHQGSGIVTAYVKKMLSYCFTVHRIEKIYARIDKKNKGSSRVLVKNGFIPEGTMAKDFRNGAGQLIDVDYYGITRDDFQL